MKHVLPKSSFITQSTLMKHLLWVGPELHADGCLPVRSLFIIKILTKEYSLNNQRYDEHLDLE